MIHQEVHGKKTTPLQGVLLIAGIAAGLLLLTVLSNLLFERFHTPVFPALVYLCAIACALWLMRTRVREFHYTVDGGTFYVERVYGSRTHILLQVSLTDILLLGSAQAVRARYPKAKEALNATARECPLPVQVAAYRKDGSVFTVRLQPDENIARAVYDPAERARRAKEKWG